MKKLLRNTISLILLVFYLAGFCGFNLVKQHCFVCNQDEVHVVYKSKLGSSEQHHCSVKNDVTKECSKSSHSIFNRSKCCDLKHIYLKNNPTTTISKVSKAPLVYELSLQICNTMLLKPLFFSITYERENRHHPPIPISTSSQETLCCYLC